MTATPARPLLRRTVAGPTRPGLRIEVTGRRRFRLAQSGRTVLEAAVTADRAAVELVRVQPYRSPLPPLRAATARALHPDPDSTRWAHRFMAALSPNPRGPLHSGTWLLTAHTPGGDDDDWRRHLDEPDSTEVDWFRWPWHGGEILTPAEIPVPPLLPLRDMSRPGEDRVESYRRQSREGVLPPVLAWWVSGLFASVVLDGHDRLVAAHAENRPPTVVTLGAAVPDRRAAADVDAAIHGHGRTAELAERLRNPELLAAADRTLTGALAAAGSGFGRTRAFPPIRPGGGTESPP